MTGTVQDILFQMTTCLVLRVSRQLIRNHQLRLAAIWDHRWPVYLDTTRMCSSTGGFSITRVEISTTSHQIASGSRTGKVDEPINKLPLAHSFPSGNKCIPHAISQDFGTHFRPAVLDHSTKISFPADLHNECSAADAADQYKLLSIPLLIHI